MKYKLVIFDMDGTTLDTLHDITVSMNHSLRDLGLPEITDEESIHMQGWGVKVFSKMAAPDDVSEDMLEQVEAGFRKYYESSPKENTKPYDGILQVLAELKDRGIMMAISSNKLDKAVQQLNKTHFDGFFDFAVGFKEGLPRKPDPASVYMAMEQFGVTKEETLYVGDSETDIETAKNAGVDFLTCLWGFRSREELDAVGGRNYCAEPEDILKYIFE